jgi:hypothetical protein
MTYSKCNAATKQQAALSIHHKRHSWNQKRNQNKIHVKSSPSDLLLGRKDSKQKTKHESRLNCDGESPLGHVLWPQTSQFPFDGIRWQD